MLKQTSAVCNPYVGVFDSNMMPTVQSYVYMVPPGPLHNVGNGKLSKVQSFCFGTYCFKTVVIFTDKFFIYFCKYFIATVLDGTNLVSFGLVGSNQSWDSD